MNSILMLISHAGRLPCALQAIPQALGYPIRIGHTGLIGDGESENLCNRCEHDSESTLWVRSNASPAPLSPLCRALPSLSGLRFIGYLPATAFLAGFDLL